MVSDTLTAYGFTAKSRELSTTKSEPTNKVYHSAVYGDMVLECAIRFLCKDSTRCSRSVLMRDLPSNKLISKFKHGFTKHPLRLLHNTSLNEQHKKATLVEAWIYFLFYNYGEGHTLRYIKSQIKNNYEEVHLFPQIQW